MHLVKKRSGLLIVFFILTICLGSFVSAHLGVRPARVETNFQPGDTLYVNYYVDTNSEKRVQIKATGDFAEYVSFSKDKFTGSGGFLATVKMPAEAAKPGPNNLFIRAEEVVDEESGFGTSVTIGALIRINVPYPGKYAEIMFSIDSVNKGEPINAGIKVISRGKEVIVATAYMDLYADNQLLDSFEFGSKLLNPTEEYDFAKTINTNTYPPGIYKAVARVDYGGDKEATQEAEFRIGQLHINILNYTKEVKSGKINPFNIEISSEWKNPIDNVYANVSIYSPENTGATIASFLTPPVSINGFQTYELKAFFDATNVEGGEYPANITVYYNKNSTSELFTLIVKDAFFNLTTVLLMSAAIVLLGLFVVFFFLLKRKKKDKK